MFKIVTITLLIDKITNYIFNHVLLFKHQIIYLNIYLFIL